MHGKKILLYCTDAVVALDMSSRLKNSDYKVTEASDIETGLNCANTQKPTAVLCYYGTEKAEGRRFVDEIKNSTSYNGPIIGLGFPRGEREGLVCSFKRHPDDNLGKYVGLAIKKHEKKR